MNQITVQLLGRFRLQLADQQFVRLETQKAQDLLCFLLLNPDVSHHRDQLADILWASYPTKQAKRYLSKALHHIQKALGEATEAIIHIEPDWLEIRRNNPRLVVDVWGLESLYYQARGIAGESLAHELAAQCAAVVERHDSDLLTGNWDDLFLLERERYRQLYLGLCDKLIRYAETNERYEEGIGYGRRVLRLDSAREHTHRCLMRLYYFSRNRSAALRQYEQCRLALEQELHVEPAHQTKTLYEAIKSDILSKHAPTTPSAGLQLNQIMAHLTQLKQNLKTVQGQIDSEIQAVQALLDH